MSKSVAIAKPSLLVPAAIGGILGGVLIDLYLITIGHQPVPGLWQFVASTVVGPTAFTSTSWVALGLLLHFATSIVWAILYVLVWRNLSNWIVGGLVWGVVVLVAMGIFLSVKASVPFPTGGALVGSVIGHWLYMLPAAWYIARSVRNA